MTHSHLKFSPFERADSSLEYVKVQKSTNEKSFYSAMDKYYFLLHEINTGMTCVVSTQPVFVNIIVNPYWLE